MTPLSAPTMPTAPEAEPGVATAAGPVLQVQNLGVRFPGAAEPVVRGVSFEVRAGEVLAMVGESGAGKTLTGLAVLGLLPPGAHATGSIRLTGDPDAEPVAEQANLVGAPPASWRGLRGRVAALVFQEPQTALNPVRTVGWQLVEALRAHRRISRAAARVRAVELLSTVGIPDPQHRVDSYPHQLSGGQKQRVVIALALAGEPALLVADEPTTALDVTVQAEILTLINDLRHRLGMAVLLITHNMGVVAELADRVLVMRDGEVVETDDVVPLFTAPTARYTQQLLAAVPAPIRVIESAPDPVAPIPTAAPLPGAALDVRDLVVSYPARRGQAELRALSGVSLTVAPGRVLGVVGESGSGKTTLIRAISGRLPVHSGRLTIAGTELGSLAGRELRRFRAQLGVVHQDPATTLDPLLTVGQSVAEPLRLHQRRSSADIRRRVRTLLDQVRLPGGVEHRLPHELSGGQRQRVALARALILGPSLVLADEPTSALDVTVQAVVLELFADLQAELGFASVFISHDLGVIAQVSDSVLVLRDGVAVESGPTRRVLSRPGHPYTRQLLAAVPRPDPVRQRDRRSRT